jgi:peptidoglycan/LPS O-acetylase OafA/YrhL
MKKLPSLDGLRAISILSVLSAHMLPLGPKVLHLNESAGAMGMSLFFALSGFLITSNLLSDQRVSAFLVRRLTRVLPLAYLYLLLSYLFFGYHPAMLPGNVLFVENYFHSYLDDWNAHFWSLCVEVHFYIWIALMVALFGARAIWIVLPACLAVTILRISNGVFISIETHLRADEILAGASVALLFKYGFLKDARLATGSLIFALLFWFFASSEFTGPVQYLRPYSSATLLAVVLRLAPGVVLSSLEGRALRYIAQISYALYVVHPATMHGWMNEGSPFERYILKRPISLASAFLFAHLSTFYFESKWIAWGKRLTVRRIATV